MMPPGVVLLVSGAAEACAAAEGRAKMPDEFGSSPLKRVHDMSLTQNESFLKNEDGVDMPE